MSKHNSVSLTNAAILVLVAKRKAKLHGKIVSNSQHVKNIEAQIEAITAQINAGLLVELKQLAEDWTNKLIKSSVIPVNVSPVVAAHTCTLHHKLQATTRVGMLTVNWRELTNGRYEVENAFGHLNQPVTGASIPKLPNWVQLQDQVSALKEELILARKQSYETVRDLGALPEYESALKLSAAKKHIASKKGRSILNRLKKSV